MSENEESEGKKSGLLVKIKKRFRIGGKKNPEKDSVAESITGKSDTSQRSNLKYVNLIPTSKIRKEPKNHALKEQNELAGEAPQLLNAPDQVSTSSRYKAASEDIRLDVGGRSMNDKITKGDVKEVLDDEEEQLRLYREMHEVRKQMILKEKKFQEEKLEFYKLQMEADNIIEQHNIK